MAHHIKDKAAARKATRVAQVSAVALAVLGGAVAVAKIPGLEIKDIEPAPVGPVASGAQTNTEKPDPVSRPDAILIDENLSYIGNAPVPKTTAAADEPDSNPIDTGGGLSDRDIRFIGLIKSGGRASAFLNIAGVTKILRPGDVYEGVKLVEVVGDEITVSIDGGEEEMIGKAERKGSAVSVVTGGAPSSPQNTANTAVAGDEPPTSTPDMSREERRAALLERAKADRGRWQRDRGENGGPPN
jgi:hypothetical protein